MNLRERLDRLEKLLHPAADGTFSDFQREFLAADPAHERLYRESAARHHTTSFRWLLRRDLELRNTVGRWCVSAVPGALVRLPLSRLIHVPNIPGEKTECKVVVRPERHEDGSEFLQLWLTEPTTVRPEATNGHPQPTA